MEQITSMKITGLTLTNFRNHSETEHFDFGDLSYITGHNGTGKTTIANIIAKKTDTTARSKPLWPTPSAMHSTE